MGAGTEAGAVEGAGDRAGAVEGAGTRAGAGAIVGAGSVFRDGVGLIF